MDQLLTGKFIASVRKEKGYTQKQLAEELNISDKTISKWETGNGFPEISLLLPLCEKLEITVNELLTGEYLTETQYKQKAEENMVNMIKEKEENIKKMKMAAITGTIATIAFVVIILMVALYTDVMPTEVKVVLVAIACVIFGVGIYSAMQAERTIGYYQCKKCGEYFVPNFWQYSMGMHMLTTRHLKCPHCGKKSWCKKVMTKEE